MWYTISAPSRLQLSNGNNSLIAIGMKRNLTIILILGFTLLGHTPVHAQFLKKLFGGKEESKPKPKPRPRPQPAGDKKTAAKEKKKTQPDEIVYPKSIKRDRYRIDVFVALYLDEIIKGTKPVSRDKIPEKAIAGMNFYEGVKMATDSLDRMGYSLDVYVHDITNAKETPEAMIAAKQLDSTDLIIGAVSANYVAPLAQFARKKTINFVSTLSPSDGNVKDNPYLTLLQPTLQAHCDWVRNAVVRKWKNETVTVYRRPAVSVDELAYKTLVKDSLFRMTTVNVTTLPPASYLKAMFDSTETNVVLMPVIDVNHATKLLNQLDSLFPNYNFEVYGMPSWKGMSALRKTTVYQKIGISLTAPFYVDASTASGQALSADYKKTFGSRPGEMVYRGYETMYWYAYLLGKYGTIFNTRISDNASANYTRFDIRPRYDKDFNLLYNENTHFYLFRYQDGSFTVEQ